MSNSWDVVVLGCGKLGGKLKNHLSEKHIHTLGVRRNKNSDQTDYLNLDLVEPASWDHLEQLPFADKVVLVVTVTPDQRTEADYLKSYLEMAKSVQRFINAVHASIRIVWVSSTAVFGQQQLGVLDEGTPANPDNWRGRILLDAENIIAQLSVPHHIIRFSGLYDSQSLLRLSLVETRNKLNPYAVTNRFHRDDAVNLLVYVIESMLSDIKLPTIIHGVDANPTTYQNLFDFLDGRIDTLPVADPGRIIATQFRSLLPALLYPTPQLK